LPLLSRFWIFGAVVGVVALLVFAIRRKGWSSSKAAPQATMPTAQLVDLRNGKPFLLKALVTRIGRKPDNDIVLTETTVSGHHAQIEYRDQKFFLRDLDSANATKVNDGKVQGEVQLKSGDILRFDVFGFTFMQEESDPDKTVLRQTGGPSGTVLRQGPTHTTGKDR
jgi:pSer/pThr/pTyr-binding forkhead associated (FHA) protein